MKTADKKKYPFRVVGVRNINVETFRRAFFWQLWEMLDVEQPKLPFHWADDDVLMVGDSYLTFTYINVPTTPATGRIDLWVDDLVAARRSLNRRCIPILDGLPSAGLQCDGFNLPPVPGHEVEIRLSQAPTLDPPSEPPLLIRFLLRIYRRFR